MTNYLIKTQPKYKRYQLIFITFMSISWVVSYFSDAYIHFIEHASEHSFITYGILATFVFLFATHVVSRGVYRLFSRYHKSFWRQSLSLIINALVTTAVYCLMDFMLVISIFPFSYTTFVTLMFPPETFEITPAYAALFMFFNSIVAFLPWLIAYYILADRSGHQLLSNQLRAQQLKQQVNHIHPTFLFDTMKAIKAEINIDQDSAADLVTKASELFRYNLLASKHNLVTLKDELKALDDYFFILKKQGKCPYDTALQLKDSEQSPLFPPMVIIFAVSYLLNNAKDRIARIDIIGYWQGSNYVIEICHHSSAKVFTDNSLYTNAQNMLSFFGKGASLIRETRFGDRRKIMISLAPDDFNHSSS